jgi:Flp pilus assembly protein TadG
MAIVLPLLLLLVFAIGEFGMMYVQWSTLTNAAREGAREGALFRGTSCDAITVKSDIANKVSAYMTSSGINVATVSTTSSGECGGSGNPVTVAATVPYQFAVLPALAGLQSSVTLSANSVMRNE